MRIHSDRLAAAAIIAVAALAYALTFTFDEVPAAIKQGMGPERFPQLIAIVIVALCLVLAVQARGAETAGPEPLDPAVLVVAGSAVVFMGAIWLIGLIPAMALALVALGVLWGERRRVAMLLNALLLPAAIWVVFVRMLKVPLPTGLAGQLLGLGG